MQQPRIEYKYSKIKKDKQTEHTNCRHTVSAVAASGRDCHLVFYHLAGRERRVLRAWGAPGMAAALQASASDLRLQPGGLRGTLPWGAE